MQRRARRWITRRVQTVGLGLAPKVPPGAIGLVERCLGRFGPLAPRIARQVADNMRIAGVYSSEAHREYFRQVARHLANALRVFGVPAGKYRIEDLVDGQIDTDDSIAFLTGAMQNGRGVVVAAPHVCNYVLTLIRLAREVPICVYLRWSGDPAKRRLKAAWCRAAGLNVFAEPASATDPSSRAAALVDLLREGKAVVMTPDIAQKAERGVPVRLFDRQAYLPTGPASIALLAEAPLVPVFGRTDGERHTIVCRPPIAVESVGRAAGGRPAAIRRAMQQWTDEFERFVRAQPHAWFLWGDSRWTRVFRGDPKYTGAAGVRSVDAGSPSSSDLEETA